MNNCEMILVIIPSLVAQLVSAEQEKGVPLTEAEVLRIRDESECIAVPPDVIPTLIKERGYEDLDPEKCWEQWQEVRAQLV